jgi:hypothetical protein
MNAVNIPLSLEMFCNKKSMCYAREEWKGWREKRRLGRQSGEYSVCVALFLSSFNFFFSVSIHFASIIYTTYTA